MRYSLLLIAVLASFQAYAQLAVANSGMNVLAATALTIDGVTHMPSASLTIANNTGNGEGKLPDHGAKRLH